jgi:hypothetical protein
MQKDDDDEQVVRNKRKSKVTDKKANAEHFVPK